MRVVTESKVLDSNEMALTQELVKRPLRQVPGCTRSMRAPSCELWRRTVANPQGHIHRYLRDIHQSSSEGPPTFTRVPAKVPSECGWPSEYAQTSVG